MTASTDVTHAGRRVALTERSRGQLDHWSAFLADPDAALSVLDLRHAAADGWRQVVEDPSRALLTYLSAIATGEADPAVTGGLESVTVLILRTADRSEVADAAVEAVRGTVGAAALELGSRRIRVNTLVVTGAVPDEDVEAVLGYLSDRDDGGYTTGATIRLAEHAVGSLATAPVPGGRPLLITGAAGGIGRAAADLLVASGYPVVLTDLPSENLERAGRELRVPAIPANATDAAEVARLLRDPALADGLGGLLVLHGVGGSTGLDDFDQQVCDRSLVVNGTAVDTLIRAALPSLAAPATLVVLSSQAGLTAEAGNAAYCAAKFAVVGYLRGLTEPLAEQGIRVQVLCPGPVDTPLMRNAFAGLAAAAGVSVEQFTADRLGLIPLGGAGTPQQMAAAVSLLARLRSTGVVLAPTGGETLS